MSVTTLTRFLSAKALAITCWLSASTISTIGKPKQQRSQVVLPAAPIARSAFAINCAILVTLTRTAQAKLACLANLCTLLICGAVLPMTTVTLNDCVECWTKVLRLCKILSVTLSLSTPPRLTNILLGGCTLLRLSRLIARQLANSSRNSV